LLEDVAVLKCLLNFALLLQGSLAGGGGEEAGSGEDTLERMPVMSVDDTAELAR
jgi:hypothetical protein